MVFQAFLWYFLEYQDQLWNTKMSGKAVRLTEAKVKNASPNATDYVLGDGDGLQSMPGKVALGPSYGSWQHYYGRWRQPLQSGDPVGRMCFQASN